VGVETASHMVSPGSHGRFFGDGSDAVEERC